MDAKEKIQALLETSKDGTVTAAQVSAAGLHRSILQELVEMGELYRFSRGLYVQNNAWEDDFYLLQLKYGRGNLLARYSTVSAGLFGPYPGEIYNDLP